MHYNLTPRTNEEKKIISNAVSIYYAYFLQ